MIHATNVKAPPCNNRRICYKSHVMTCESVPIGLTRKPRQRRIITTGISVASSKKNYCWKIEVSRFTLGVSMFNLHDSDLRYLYPIMPVSVWREAVSLGLSRNIEVMNWQCDLPDHTTKPFSERGPLHYETHNYQPG